MKYVDPWWSEKSNWGPQGGTGDGEAPTLVKNGHPSKPLVPVPLRTGTKGCISTGSLAQPAEEHQYRFVEGLLYRFILRTGTKGFQSNFEAEVGPELNL
jgi:hypothetical protein